MTTDIVAAIRSRLVADSAVDSLVVDRVYADDAPQGAVYPLITLRLISSVRGYILSGSDGQSQPRVQIEAWAETKAGAVSVIQAVIASLEDERFTYSGALIGPSRVVNERDMDSLLQGIPQLRGRMIDILTWISE